MELEAIRGMVARHPGPYELSMADGSRVRVISPKHMFLPPEEVRDPRTIVVYGPEGQFKLLDALMIVAAAPVTNGANGANGH